MPDRVEPGFSGDRSFRKEDESLLLDGDDLLECEPATEGRVSRGS
jgi:hypothetical protein